MPLTSNQQQIVAAIKADFHSSQTTIGQLQEALAFEVFGINRWRDLTDDQRNLVLKAFDQA